MNRLPTSSINSKSSPHTSSSMKVCGKKYFVKKSTFSSECSGRVELIP